MSFYNLYNLVIHFLQIEIRTGLFFKLRTICVVIRQKVVYFECYMHALNTLLLCKYKSRCKIFLLTSTLFGIASNIAIYYDILFCLGYITVVIIVIIVVVVVVHQCHHHYSVIITQQWIICRSVLSTTFSIVFFSSFQLWNSWMTCKEIIIICH